MSVVTASASFEAEVEEFLPTWCIPKSSYQDDENLVPSPERPRHLDRTAQEFLRRLDLPRIHPICHHSRQAPALRHVDDWTYVDVPRMGERTTIDGLASAAATTHEDTFRYTERLSTFVLQALPTSLAMAELWLRLFAFYLTPLCIAYLLPREVMTTWSLASSSSFVTNHGDNNKGGRLFSFVVSTDHKKKKNNNNGGTKKKKNSNNKNGRNGGNAEDSSSTTTTWLGRHMPLIALVVGMYSSSVIMTDELYVHEFGMGYGTVQFAILAILYLWKVSRHGLLLMEDDLDEDLETSENSKQPTGGDGVGGSQGASLLSSSNKRDRAFRLICSTLCFYTLIDSCHFYLSQTRQAETMDVPTIQPGLYHDETNVEMASIWKYLSLDELRYEGRIRGGGDGDGDNSNDDDDDASSHQPMALPTPYLITGDSRTGIPFLVNRVRDEPHYHRVWVRSNEEPDEAVALDIAFPPDGRHNVDEPLYVILHGLNGGSHEEYVMEFVNRETSKGSTVAVMIARGLMDTPVVGRNIFNGARVSDIDATAKALKRAASATKTKLIGAGYSMGAIILSNYVARSGKDCHLDAAIAVSGGLDMREQITFRRSMKLWQPMLAQGLREIILGKFRDLYQDRLTRGQYLELLRAPDVSTIDLHAVVTYNGYTDLLDYYSSMSAMGDFVTFNGTKGDVGRIGDVSVPFFVVHALDDPLCTWRTMGRNPQALAESGSGYTALVLTKGGGHVGWPLRNNPASEGWAWMNGAVSHIARAVVMAASNDK